MVDDSTNEGNLMQYLNAASEASDAEGKLEAINKGLGYLHALTFNEQMTEDENNEWEEKFFDLLPTSVHDEMH